MRSSRDAKFWPFAKYKQGTGGWARAIRPKFTAKMAKTCTCMIWCQETTQPSALSSSVLNFGCFGSAIHCFQAWIQPRRYFLSGRELTNQDELNISYRQKTSGNPNTTPPSKRLLVGALLQWSEWSSLASGSPGHHLKRRSMDPPLWGPENPATTSKIQMPAYARPSLDDFVTILSD